MKKFVLILAVITLLIFSGCSTMAMNLVANALTGDGGSEVFTGDPDPELVGDAIPFAIKMYEALLSQNPKHQGLILTTGSMFIMYANAFVQGPVEFLPQSRYLERQEALIRAKKLYLRGADILYDGLDKKYKGFAAATPEKRANILKKMKKADVPSLYWTAAGYLAAFSTDPMDMELMFKIPELLAMIDRAYVLDPNFNSGSLDDFLVLFHASVPETMGGDKSKVEIHYKRALEKSGGLLAGPYVSYAQAVCIPQQDYETFKLNLDAALAINPDLDPVNRLVNIINQTKARKLLDSAANYFIYLDNNDWDDWD